MHFHNLIPRSSHHPVLTAYNIPCTSQEQDEERKRNAKQLKDLPDLSDMDTNFDSLLYNNIPMPIKCMDCGKR